jgi:hypothetical protein
MTRKIALENIKYAGYHQDPATLIRLYTENRISFLVAQDAYREGYRFKQAGMKCTCSVCNPKL